mgnify:CR=1 FL=1
MITHVAALGYFLLELIELVAAMIPYFRFDFSLCVGFFHSIKNTKFFPGFFSPKCQDSKYRKKNWAGRWGIFYFYSHKNDKSYKLNKII